MSNYRAVIATNYANCHFSWYIAPTYRNNTPKIYKMPLDSTFIQNLIIPFNEVLPPGTLPILRDEFKVSEHTPRKVLKGEFSNEEIAEAGLRHVIQHHDLLVRFLKQFPDETIAEIKAKLPALAEL